MAQIWNDDEDKIVRDNWGKLPTKQIAAMLGRTKNAVIGRAYRLLKECKKPPAPKPVYYQRKLPTVIKRTDTVPQLLFSGGQEAANDIPLPCTLAEIKAGMCVYPTGKGPYLFCGLPVISGKSYCVECYNKCYMKGK